MIILVAHYQVKDGLVDDVLAKLAAMAQAVRDTEPGCLMYQISQGQSDSNVIVLYEQYADEAAVAAHRETPHFKDIVLGQVVPMLENRTAALYDCRIK